MDEIDIEILSSHYKTVTISSNLADTYIYASKIIYGMDPTTGETLSEPVFVGVTRSLRWYNPRD